MIFTSQIKTKQYPFQNVIFEDIIYIIYYSVLRMSLYSDFGDQAYKLLRLSPELLEYLEQPDAMYVINSDPLIYDEVL